MSFFSLNNIYFTQSSSWVCPENVMRVLVIASGGGGGGAAGSTGWGGGGSGGGSLQQTGYLNVLPGSAYSINIGAGGQGGAYDGISNSTGNGKDGSSTNIVDINNNVVFYTLGGGGAGVNAPYPSFGGAAFAGANGAALSLTVPTYEYTFPGSGAIGSGAPGASAKNAMMNLTGGYSIGLSTVDAAFCGAGGGAGPQGKGADGGLGLSNSPGANAGENTGAGGGGGGNNNSALIGGNGGSGGSGYLCLVW